MAGPKFYTLKRKRDQWEAVADAILDLGEESTPTKIANKLSIPQSQVASTIGSSSFKAFFEARLTQRGFDGNRFQGAVRELGSLIIEELTRRLKTKEYKEKLSERELLNILLTANQSLKYAVQSEDVVSNKKGNKKVLTPKEVMARMMNSSSGRAILQKSAAKKSNG